MDPGFRYPHIRKALAVSAGWTLSFSQVLIGRLLHQGCIDACTGPSRPGWALYLLIFRFARHSAKIHRDQC